jgi:hypothetical protein
MRLHDALNSIQRRETEVLRLAGKYTEEQNPVKKRILQYIIEGYIQWLLVTTRIYCRKTRREADEEGLGYLLAQVQKAYDSEEYMTVGDVKDASYVSTKFRNLEPLNIKPYEESIISS